MSSEWAALRKTGKRKRAKKIVMDTGQLKPGEVTSGAAPAVQSDRVTDTEVVACGGDEMESAVRTREGAWPALRTREGAWPALRTWGGTWPELTTRGGAWPVLRTREGARSALRTREGAWSALTPPRGGAWSASSGTVAAQLRRTVAMFVVLMVLLPDTAAQGRSAPVITIPQGSLLGVREFVDPRQRPVFAYKGIPYATPPVGRLRFKSPVRDSGWNRTQRFDRFGPACPQLDAQGVPEPGVSEDCLTLNVWIPQDPDGFRRFPVVIFLDGELFWRQRASRFPLQELSSQDIVTVSVSYRTNLFGFLTLQSSAAPGNLGLRDQQLALRWVRDNIGAFGGDSRRVTLVGFSAGAASVGLHLVSPRSQGLFQRAVLVSGSPLATWAHMGGREARGIGQELAAIMGCRSGSDGDTVRCLQDQDFMRLLTAGQRILESRGRFYPVFAPVTDSFLITPARLLPEDPERLLRRGNFVKVPVMTGIDADDGLLMLYQYPGTDRLTFSNLTSVLRRVVIPRLLDQRQLSRSRRSLLEGVLSYRYVDTVPPGSQQLMLASFVKIFSDAYFVAPLYSFLDLYTRSGADVYAYSYTGKGPDIFGNVVSLEGAGHGSELLYLLGPSMYRAVVGGTYGPAQQRLGQKLRAYWRGFVTEGDPVRNRYGERWDKYTLDRPVFQDLVRSTSEVGYRREDASYWNTFLGFIADENTTPDPGGVITQPLVGSQAPYETIMWVLLAVVILLMLGLLVAFLLTRRRRRLKSDMAYG